jgi:hypothetical protein
MPALSERSVQRELVNFMGDRGKTLTRLPPDYDPGVAILSRSAGEGLGRTQLKAPLPPGERGGPSPKGLVGEGARRPSESRRKGALDFVSARWAKGFIAPRPRRTRRL